jgi:hypothetical protein
VSSTTPNTPEPNNNNNNNNDEDDKDAPKHLDWVPDASSLAPLQFEPLSDSERGWANFKLLFALPWRRFKKDAVLSFKLEGEIADQLQVRQDAAAAAAAAASYPSCIETSMLVMRTEVAVGGIQLTAPLICRPACSFMGLLHAGWHSWLLSLRVEDAAVLSSLCL